jgi:Domain of unknown function (DUF4258)
MIDKGARFDLSAHATVAVREREIKLDWIRRALERPARVEPDKVDISLQHALLAIPEHGNRVLRVVVDPSAMPVRVVTAYFDRNMRGKL